MLYHFPDGSSFPAVGLGTWKATGNDAYEAVKAAISFGYRHIDTAYVYGNEAQVGKAINEKIADGTIDRSDIFVTTKLWNTFHAEEAVMRNINQSLNNLGLDYVDLYLIHWPMSLKEGEDLFPKDENNCVIEGPGQLEETWRGMEAVKNAGLAKNIGLSNFNPSQIARILSSGTIKPVVNQFEAHPFLDNREWVDFCTANGIITTAYSPLGSPDRPWADKAKDISFTENGIVKELAAKHGKSAVQILLRFHLERGSAVIPKSLNPDHIKSNFDIFGFELSSEDMSKLSSLACSNRVVGLESYRHLKEYPF